MSDLLLTVPGRKVTLGASILDVHNNIKTDLTSVGWRVVSEVTTGTVYSLVVCPPASEAVGNAYGRDVLLIETDMSSIKWRPICEALQAYPQSLYLIPKTGGTASNAVTIGAVTVAQDAGTLNAANTANDNLRYLYEALAASTDPAITDWNWMYQYPSPQNADMTTPAIYGVRKTAAANIAITPNANVTGGILGNYHAAGIQLNSVATFCNPETLSIDLVNGFIYFLQINKRGLAFSTRTNMDYFGPVHACWGENARANAALPDSGIFNRFLTPVELVVGVDKDNTSSSSLGRVAHYIGIGCAIRAQRPNIDNCEQSHPFSRFSLPNVFLDSSCIGGAYNQQFVIAGSGIWDEAAADIVGNNFQIHRATMTGNSKFAGNSGGQDGLNSMTCIIPLLKIDDWYKFTGTATDENLQYCADTVTTTTLAQVMEKATDYPSITLADASALPSAGMVMIENEAIEYTGKTGNTLTGCTRAKYASVRAKHFSGCPVYPGLWFIKIKGGAVFCGNSCPA